MSSPPTRARNVPVGRTPPEAPAPVHNERAQLLRCMLADRGWCDDPALRLRLQDALDALRRSAAGRPVDEATWTLVADETARYLDYRRLGNLEAQLRGCTRDELRYTRADWETSRMAEAALEAHHRHARETSYVPEPAPLFRIH